MVEQDVIIRVRLVLASENSLLEAKTPTTANYRLARGRQAGSQQPAPPPLTPLTTSSLQKMELRLDAAYQAPDFIIDRPDRPTNPNRNIETAAV